MDCSLTGSSVYGIFPARVLEWVAISFSRGSSLPRDWTGVSHIASRCFTLWATREAPKEIAVQENLLKSRAEGVVASLWGVVGPYPLALPPPVYIPRGNILCIESEEESLKPSEIFRAKCWVRSRHSGDLNGGREGGWMCASRVTLRWMQLEGVPHSWPGSPVAMWPRTRHLMGCPPSYSVPGVKGHLESSQPALCRALC